MFSSLKINIQGLSLRPPLFLIASLFSLVFILSGCGEDDYSSNTTGGTPGANEIFIQNMAFSPASKTISVGTTIKWINKDAAPHTVTSGIPGAPTGIFNSNNMGQNAQFSFTFNQAGTFKYFCNIHQSMTGTITVQ